MPFSLLTMKFGNGNGTYIVCEVMLHRSSILNFMKMFLILVGVMFELTLFCFKNLICSEFLSVKSLPDVCGGSLNCFKLRIITLWLINIPYSITGWPSFLHWKCFLLLRKYNILLVHRTCRMQWETFLFHVNCIMHQE